MNGQSTIVKGFAALPGQATAVYTSSGLDHYRHSDWLGSARLTSSPSRAYISSVAYAPFGENYAQSGTADFSFTGQNSDTASGDYDFLYREYSNQGRWASPDPAGLAAVNPSFPQSWNRYAYVQNNPLALTDPLGLVCYHIVTDDHGNSTTVPDWNKDDDAACKAAYGSNAIWIDPVDTTVVVNGDDNNGPNGLAPGCADYFVNGFYAGSTCGNSSGGNFKPAVAYTFSLVVPLYFGFGPAVTISYVPSQNLFCGGGGGGVSLGHSVSMGPVLVDANHTKDILGGASVSGGYNSTPYQGAQGSMNTSGSTGGYSFGIPGFSGSVTYSGCHNF